MYFVHEPSCLFLLLSRQKNDYRDNAAHSSHDLGCVWNMPGDDASHLPLIRSFCFFFFFFVFFVLEITCMRNSFRQPGFGVRVRLWLRTTKLTRWRLVADATIIPREVGTRPDLEIATLAISTNVQLCMYHFIDSIVGDRSEDKLVFYIVETAAFSFQLSASTIHLPPYRPTGSPGQLLEWMRRSAHSISMACNSTIEYWLDIHPSASKIM